MNRNRTLAACLFAIALFILTSCAVAPHPNEKIIVGTWKPVKVEQIVDSSALKASISHSSDSTRKNPKPGRSAVAGGGNKKEATLDRLAQNEMRATLEIFADKTAIKNYPGKPLHATWKMKGRGKRLVGKNVDNKMKFVIDILEIRNEEVTVMEHAPVGDLKIVYKRLK